jgi:hypothetical protein
MHERKSSWQSLITKAVGAVCCYSVARYLKSSKLISGLLVSSMRADRRASAFVGGAFNKLCWRCWRTVLAGTWRGAWRLLEAIKYDYYVWLSGVRGWSFWRVLVFWLRIIKFSNFITVKIISVIRNWHRYACINTKYSK